MDINNYMDWQVKQGNKVFQTASSYWYEAGPRVLQAFPYEWLITPSKDEINELLVKHGIMAVRYSTPVELSKGKLSYHLTRFDPLDLHELRRNTRQQIKKGLSQCQIKQIPLECLANDCWEIQSDTLIRQDRSNSMNENEWKKLCLSADGIKGFESWAAIFEENIVAAIFTFQTQETCYFMYSLSLREYQNYYVNHALFYSVIQKKLEQESINQIFCTVQSLDASDQVDEFKFRMGFQPRIVRQRVEFHPWIKPMVNNVSYRIINRLNHLVPNNNFLSKGEGMFRFYMEGELPLEKQELPERLHHYKEELINVNSQ